MARGKSDEFFKKIEDLFVKIFRVVILITMAIALILSVIAAVTGAMKMMSTEKEPAPAVPAPKKGIDVDDFLKALTPSTPAKPKAEPEGEGEGEKQEVKKVEAIKFMAEATKIYECGAGLTAKVGAQTEAGPEEVRRAVEFLRTEIQRLASFKARGQEWVTSLAAFVCAVTQNQKVVELAKKGQKILIPAINFHVRAWDRLDEEREAHEAREEKRIAKERLKEQVRVAEEKAFGLTALMVAGGAFAAFMIIALYLIFAKIEANLGLIHRDIEEATNHNAHTA